MGFFSWRTADTGESIWNTYSQMPVRTVYLLQPDGAEPITELAYEGYGQFGGIDAYNWLAKANLPADKIKDLSESQVSMLGVTLSVGQYFVDTVDGTKHSVFHEGPSLLDPDIRFHGHSYSDPVSAYGLDANKLVASGRWKPQTFDTKNPLKFSFSKDAVYEDLPGSPNCPQQGYFEPDPEDDEADD